MKNPYKTEMMDFRRERGGEAFSEYCIMIDLHGILAVSLLKYTDPFTRDGDWCIGDIFTISGNLIDSGLFLKVGGYIPVHL